jgi:hypothetical protein
MLRGVGFCPCFYLWERLPASIVAAGKPLPQTKKQWLRLSVKARKPGFGVKKKTGCRVQSSGNKIN